MALHNIKLYNYITVHLTKEANDFNCVIKDKQTKTTKKDRSKKTTSAEKLQCVKHIAFSTRHLF